MHHSTGPGQWHTAYPASTITLYTKNPSVLLQLINRISKGLMCGLDVAQDIAVALMSRGLAGIMHTLLFGELAEKRMPQHMGGDINFLILGEVGIGLSGDTADDAVCFTARKPSAGARHKEGRGVVLPCLEPFIQDLAGGPIHRHNIPDDRAFDLHADKSLAGVLVPIQVQNLRDPQA